MLASPLMSNMQSQEMPRTFPLDQGQITNCLVKRRNNPDLNAGHDPYYRKNHKVKPTVGSIEIKLDQGFDDLGFTAEDFSDDSFSKQKLRIASLVYQALSQGHSFAAIKESLPQYVDVSQPAGLNPEMKIRHAYWDGIYDRGINNDSEASRRRAQYSSEFQEMSLASSLGLALIEKKVGTLPEFCLSPFFSALASFAIGRKVLISDQMLEQLHSDIGGIDEIVDQLMCRRGERNHTLIPRINIEENTRVLLLSSEREEVISLSESLTKEVRGLDRGLLDAGQIDPQLLPTKRDQETAVRYMLSGNRLERFVNRSRELMEKALDAKDPKGYPDHDRRHILYAVPITALSLSAGKDLYTTIFGFIGAQWHDAGRIIEPEFDFQSAERKRVTKIHPLISGGVLSQFLDDYPGLPESVRNELLIGVSQHDTPGVLNSRVCDFLQACDRYQLLGPEVFLRFLGIYTGCHNTAIFPEELFAKSYRQTFMGGVSHYMHEVYPNFVNENALEERLAVTSYAMLEIACTEASKRQRNIVLPPRHLMPARWRGCKFMIREEVKKEKTAFLEHGKSNYWDLSENAEEALRTGPHQLADQMLNQPLASQPDFIVGDCSARENIHRHIDAALEISPSFHQALAYMYLTCSANHAELEQVRSEYCKKGGVLGTLARSIIAPST